MCQWWYIMWHAWPPTNKYVHANWGHFPLNSLRFYTIMLYLCLISKKMLGKAHFQVTFFVSKDCVLE